MDASTVPTVGSRPSPVRRGNIPRLQKRAKAFSRNAAKVKARTENGIRVPKKTEDKTLAFRKIAWVEKIKVHLQKIKYRIIIGFNSSRLFCHFYSGREQRAELKDSIDIARRQLNILHNQQSRRDNFERAQENIQDGQYKEAIVAGCKAMTAGLREGWGKVAQQLKTDLG